MQVITKETIVKELQTIGLEKDDVVMVHTSLKKYFHTMLIRITDRMLGM